MHIVLARMLYVNTIINIIRRNIESSVNLEAKLYALRKSRFC